MSARAAGAAAASRARRSDARSIVGRPRWLSEPLRMRSLPCCCGSCSGHPMMRRMTGRGESRVPGGDRARLDSGWGDHRPGVVKSPGGRRLSRGS